ncbi:response regulator [Pseudobacteriovorax antillogorgiicola]|uniref:Response regulator receiver domain-containing protein n=1 Tax=Pseudobacteriovorax antillogorgiicola TaxID=1513793 RepID=A0A1Y6BHF7_9BACT|nr:response regulator [Pseudobacteriovorax antillogorgiicola]TCS55517.1 response regulator receiver domain-containing protein [Pseudobacteriovorax antillogorgiicola]SMF11400.1 Response regulator receiver domain-containing protein [Pseudobacteriovorax antillogorgiicola]
MNVLVVDDNIEICKVIQTFLDGKDIDFTYAKDTDDALEQAKIQMPDLVLTDLNMPRGGGRKLIQVLRENIGYAIPIFVLTGEGTINDSELIGIGADRVFHKPSSMKMIAEAIVDRLAS